MYLHLGQSVVVPHRDILGSLMALGVTRETLGDILVSPRWADVLATGPAAELLSKMEAAHEASLERNK